MSNLRLFERLSRAESAPSHRGSVDQSAVVQSVMQHLQRLLNSRQGNAQTAADYGMPDFTNLLGNFSSESVDDLARNIQRVIEKYEPRLASVRVYPDQPEEVSTSVHFRIECQLAAAGGRRVPISIQTVISVEGKVAIKK